MHKGFPDKFKLHNSDFLQDILFILSNLLLAKLSSCNHVNVFKFYINELYINLINILIYILMKYK